MFVVLARFTAKAGNEQQVEDHLREMIPHALSEPGCRAYAVNKLVGDPRVFLLYEQYDDEDAFEFHRETEAFQKIVLGKLLPILKSREREICTLVEPAE